MGQPNESSRKAAKNIFIGSDHHSRVEFATPVNLKEDDTSDESTDEKEVLEILIKPKSPRSEIHDAAAFGNIEVLVGILKPGLNAVEISKLLPKVVSTDPSRKNRNILHLAAGFLGNPSIANDCVRYILNFVKLNLPAAEYEGFVNSRDDEGATPLYLAAKYENMEASRALLGGGSDLDQPNNRGKTPIMKLFKKMPGILTDAFTEKGTRSHYIDGERQIINLYFRMMISIPMAVDVVKRAPSLYREMDLLSNLSFTPMGYRGEILSDIHVKTLVWLKWQHYKILFWLARIFQITWFLLYVSYLLRLYRVECPFPGGRIYNFSWIATAPSSANFHYSPGDSQLFSERVCATWGLKMIAWILMFSAVVDSLLIEGYPTVVRFRRIWFPLKTHSLRKYIKKLFILIRILHVDKLTLLLTIFMNTIPINLNMDLFSVEGQYVFASLGMFLAWYHIFLQFGKFPIFKGFIKMLTNTIYTLCLVGMLYISLIFAFAMVFCILLPGVVTYASPFEAIIRMATFTIGEVDFENTFYGENASTPASFLLSATFFGIAIIILHIALLNFLIGLTINELKDVWKQAELWKTYTYLWQIYLCETFISSFPFPCCQTFLRRRMVLRCRYEKVSDLDQNNRKRFYKTRIDKLPKDIRKEIRKLNLEYIPSGTK